MSSRHTNQLKIIINFSHNLRAKLEQRIESLYKKKKTTNKIESLEHKKYVIHISCNKVPAQKHLISAENMIIS